jgi:CheY-like chemotaxis protein
MIEGFSSRQVVRQPSPPAGPVLFDGYFPMMALSGAGQGPPSSGPPADKLLLEHGRGAETILYVEDEAVLRSVVSDCLTQLGYQVMTAQSGEEALAISAAHAGKIDLLLTDVRMPEMTGPELAARILEHRPSLKIIYVSGYPDDVVSSLGVPASGAVFLPKPFTIKILSAKLREVLG